MLPTIVRDHAKQGFRVFVVLSLLTFLIIFYLTGTRETVAALAQFRLNYFILALLLVGCDFCFGGGRIYIFTRKISTLSESQSFMESFKANLATLFMAAATPFATGGGLAQIYILHRAGVSAPKAAAAGILNFLATIVFILIGGPIALGWLRAQQHSVEIQYVLRFSTVIFYIVTLLFFIFVFKPEWIGKGLTSWLRKIGQIWKKKASMFDAWIINIHSFIANYRSCTVTFWRNEKPTLLLNFLLTTLLFSNKCVIAFVILKGMGFNPDFLHVFAIQLLLLFIIYFSPTPGASIVAEAGATVFMANIIPRHMLPVFTLLWRFFTTYFGVVSGGIILMRTIGMKKEDSEKDEGV